MGTLPRDDEHATTMTDPAPTTPTPTLPMEGGIFHAGYLRHCEAIRAVAPSTLVPINVDVASAVITVRAAWPRIAEHRERLAETLRDFDLDAFDALDGYALALGHVHSLGLCAAVPASAARALRQRAIALRAGLLSDARALARHGLLDERKLSRLRRGPGYVNAVFDLLGLVNTFRDAWPTVATRTAVTVELLLEAETVANDLSSVIVNRKRTPEVVSALALERQQAFTLLVLAYDQVRYAIAYLRRMDDDAERIAPSIYGSRRARTRRTSPPPDTAAATETSGQALTLELAVQPQTQAQAHHVAARPNEAQHHVAQRNAAWPGGAQQAVGSAAGAHHRAEFPENAEELADAEAATFQRMPAWANDPPPPASSTRTAHCLAPIPTGRRSLPLRI